MLAIVDAITAGGIGRAFPDCNPGIYGDVVLPYCNQGRPAEAGGANTCVPAL